MDLKVNQLQQLTQMEAPKNNTPAQEDFKFTLIRNIDESELQEKLSALMKDIEEYDHPHPGIRMYYSIILYSFWIGRVRDFGEDTMAILNSGSHAVISYDKSVLLKLRTPF